MSEFVCLLRRIGSGGAVVGVFVSSCVALGLILLVPSEASAINPCPPESFPPVAEFSFSPSSPYAEQKVTFDASESEPAEDITETYNPVSEECEEPHATVHPITTYEWDFGDGVTETTSEPEVVHHFLSAATYSVKLKVHGSAGGTSVTRSHNVVVTPPAAPACSDISRSTAANTAVEVTITCGVPSESAAPGYAIDTGPSHGALSSILMNGSIASLTYTPATGYSGTDTFSYKATNEGGSSAATVSVTVNPPPSPVCQSVSSSSVGVGVEISLNCSTTAAGFANTYSIVVGPSHGTLSGLDAGAGTVTYTPRAGYSGSDSFTYTATNAGGPGNTASASIKVTTKAAGGGQGSGGQCTDSSFTFGRVRLNRKKGTATLGITVNCRGSLKLTGEGVKASSAIAQGAGTVKLKVVPTGKTKHRLVETGRVRVKVFVTFNPAGGGRSSTASKKIRLVMQR